MNIAPGVLADPVDGVERYQADSAGGASVHVWMPADPLDAAASAKIMAGSPSPSLDARCTPHWPSGAMKFGSAEVEIGFDRPKRRKHLLVRPVRISLSGPGVVVARSSSRELASVDRTRAADYPAPHDLGLGDSVQLSRITPGGGVL